MVTMATKWFDRLLVREPYTLLKLFKGAPDDFSIGDNVNPCPIDK